MTVTVNIIVASRTNVLLVPNGAVTTEGTQSYVQVISASGAIEKRAVKTGLSDWQYTEITDGLKEGEQVNVALNTASSTTTTTQRQGNMMFFGGRP
jgi:multidrug efflux pump subunit AcrA (membrane-fusion protein)